MRWTLLFLMLGCSTSLGGSEELSAQGAERFIPPELGDVKVVYCSVGGNPDGTSDADVGALYVHRGEYRALLSRRSDVLESLEDCAKWNHDVQEAIRKQRKSPAR